MKALEVARKVDIDRASFRASRGWMDEFMRRQGFSLRRRTSICHKLPADFEAKLVAYQKFAIALRKELDFLLGQIGNADETLIWFDLPMNYTVHDTGDRQVVLKTTVHEKQRVTVMLCITVIAELRSRLVVIPGGMTSVLQPLDVSANEPFRAAIRVQYDKWLSRNDLPRTPSGNIKKASPFEVAKWVKSAWDAVSPSIVEKSFKKCCLSRAGRFGGRCSVAGRRAGRPRPGPRRA
ncbi:hypothetical protein ONE63_005017 [Megalurothrips usitatus]|uniref:HTH CENPB-type domain-containing protein n=1 Tax=Megalurothrips usitatus TaxID=439358 RepID=A0AAV7X2C1_9NEOP|nr:hypothetical protein ONE63_005017 [Megalurothrips usitatus]